VKELVEGILAMAESCAHCGKTGKRFKRCSACKEALYCGAECQHANWKRHKKTCKPPLSLYDVSENVNAANATRDWRGVLKFEGRMEELIRGLQDPLVGQDDAEVANILGIFSLANRMGWNATGSKDNAFASVGLEERRIPLLGNLQRFRDQGHSMCSTGGILCFLERGADAARWFERARKIAEAHGFFTLECTACKGLGSLAISAGRREEGVALLRNALVAANLNELDDPTCEIDVLEVLRSFSARTRKQAAADLNVLDDAGYALDALRSLIDALLHTRATEVPLALSSPRASPPPGTSAENGLGIFRVFLVHRNGPISLLGVDLVGWALLPPRL
jgi:hypothetical protein